LAWLALPAPELIEAILGGWATQQATLQRNRRLTGTLRVGWRGRG